MWCTKRTHVSEQGCDWDGSIPCCSCWRHNLVACCLSAHRAIHPPLCVWLYPADNIAADFQSLFINPAASLPVIIGEFGPATISDMTMAHAETLMQQCNALGLPWLAWTLHMRCPPSLLQDLSNNGCGISMPLQLSDWGKLVKQYL